MLLTVLGGGFFLAVTFCTLVFKVVNVPGFDGSWLKFSAIAGSAVARLSFHWVSKWEVDRLRVAELRFRWAARVVVAAIAICTVFAVFLASFSL